MQYGENAVIPDGNGNYILYLVCIQLVWDIGFHLSHVASESLTHAFVLWPKVWHVFRKLTQIFPQRSVDTFCVKLYQNDKLFPLKLKYLDHKHPKILVIICHYMMKLWGSLYENWTLSMKLSFFLAYIAQRNLLWRKCSICRWIYNRCALRYECYHNWDDNLLDLGT